MIAITPPMWFQYYKTEQSNTVYECIGEDENIFFLKTPEDSEITSSVKLCCFVLFCCFCMCVCVIG